MSVVECLKMENVRIIFVINEKYNDETETLETMQQAFEVCKQNVKTKVSWLKESLFNTLKLLKTDFIVFEEFEGTLFETLKSSKSARIVGPWAVSVCLMEGTPIPNFDWPIYNVALYNCIITCSHLAKNIKTDIRTKVELMGGCYVDSLVEKTTHLITGSAKSEKYLAAAESGLKLMCQSWIEDVWNTSQDANVHGDDEQFRKHRCLAFHNLIISSTGLTNLTEKQAIEKMVTENGGTFTGKLNLTTTDILICAGDVTNSDKYKAARKVRHIKCVNPSWVSDSFAKGYALPHNLYKVQKMTSTPTKPERFVNPEFSILSAIGGTNTSQRTWIEDTIANTTAKNQTKGGNAKRKAQEYCDELIDNLDIKKAKRAGQFLDGCSVYLTGFSSDHTEKLNKIINLSGATRYDTFSERVTHVLVGDSSHHEVALIRNKNTSAVLVSIHWLIDSIEQENPVNEEKYLIVNSDLDNNQLGSPLSKKGLSLLRSNRTITEKEIQNHSQNDKRMDQEPPLQNTMMPEPHPPSDMTDTLGQLLEGIDANLLKHSEQVHEPPKAVCQFQPANCSTQQSSISITQDAETETPAIFENMKFLIVGFEEEEFEKLQESITDHGGEVVRKTFKGIPDYAVVPIFNQNELHYTATEVVNELFISDCVREEEMILSLAYYHKPFDLPETKPIENCVVTLSGHTGLERTFLKNLIEALGGVAQEQFARIRQEEKKLFGSTHLISTEASGKKYEAALKWRLPVVSKDWLLECAKTGKRANEAHFLIGISEAPERENYVENTPQRAKSTKGSDKPDTPADRSKIATPGKILTPVNRNSNTPGPSRLSISGTPKNMATPYHKRFLNSAEKMSQVTPVHKIMKQFRESNMDPGTSSKQETKEYKVPQPWDSLKTPEAPYGAFLTPDPSPGLRKQWEYWLQQFPDKATPKSNTSTPISELKRRYWEKFELKHQNLDFDENENGNESESTENTPDTTNIELPSSDPAHTPDSQQLASKFQKLEEMLSASGSGKKRQSRNFQSTVPVQAGSSEFKDSQPCTVGWDFRPHELQGPKAKIFALSGIGDNDRAKMFDQLEQLGATVTNLSNYDPCCTHLLCLKPARNEKSLSCMAAGKWILHVSYLEKSVEAGHFLDEEEYEFGNPKSIGKIPGPDDRETESRMQKMHWWRKEIARRGYGAFNDMRAIVMANKREPINRVIEAGGGIVIDVKPPFEDTVHATHCLLEPKSVNLVDYIPLAKQGIFVLNTIYISDYLYQPNRDIRDCIFPQLSKYYARN